MLCQLSYGEPRLGVSDAEIRLVIIPEFYASPAGPKLILCGQSFHQQCCCAVLPGQPCLFWRVRMRLRWSCNRLCQACDFDRDYVLSHTANLLRLATSAKQGQADMPAASAAAYLKNAYPKGLTSDRSTLCRRERPTSTGLSEVCQAWVLAQHTSYSKKTRLIAGGIQEYLVLSARQRLHYLS